MSVVEPPSVGVGQAFQGGGISLHILYSKMYTNWPCEHISYLFTVIYTYKVVVEQGVEPVRPCFGNSLTTRSLWSNTFDGKRLSAAAESTGFHLSPLESTPFVEK